jgi:hypothetical protein
MTKTAVHPFDGRRDGSMAEQAYLRHNPSAARFGHDLPTDANGALFRLDRMPSIARSLPDFMIHTPYVALVECQGGKRANGWITVKTRKLADLRRHREHFGIYVIVWTYLSDADEFVAVDVESLSRLTEGLEVRSYPDGSEYVRVPLAALPTPEAVR